LGKRIQLTGTTLRTRSNAYKANLIKDFLDKALPAFEDDRLKPIIDKVMDWTEVGAAHERLERDIIGKIVLSIVSDKQSTL